MAKPIVYLAGAIAGIAFKDAMDWRVDAGCILANRGIECLNPMREKRRESLGAVIATDFHQYEQSGAFFTSRGIMARDFNDVKRCDALLVNLLGAEKPSLGTVMEMGWAYCLRKPVVVVMEKKGNPHDNHPMLHEAMPFRFETLYDAIDAVAIILGR